LGPAIDPVSKAETLVVALDKLSLATIFALKIAAADNIVVEPCIIMEFATRSRTLPVSTKDSSSVSACMTVRYDIFMFARVHL
jgi:hypothetical protein